MEKNNASEAKHVVPTETKIVVPEDRFGYNFKPVVGRIQQISPQQQSQGQQNPGAQSSAQGNASPQSGSTTQTPPSDKK